MYDKIDYEVHIETIDNHPVAIGYRISKFALHTIIINKYGYKAVSILLEQISTVMYHYIDYHMLFTTKRIESLNRTIVGFSTDINELHTTISEMKRNSLLSRITEKDSYDSIPMLGEDRSHSSTSTDTNYKNIVKDKEKSELTVGIMCEMLEELTMNINNNISPLIGARKVNIATISGLIHCILISYI